MVGLKPTGFKEVELLDYLVTGIFPLDFEAIRGDSAQKGCRSNLLEGSACILRFLAGKGLNCQTSSLR